jgi:hypothetical protein
LQGFGDPDAAGVYTYQQRFAVAKSVADISCHVLQQSVYLRL